MKFLSKLPPFVAKVFGKRVKANQDEVKYEPERITAKRAEETHRKIMAMKDFEQLAAEYESKMTDREKAIYAELERLNESI